MDTFSNIWTEEDWEMMDMELLIPPGGPQPELSPWDSVTPSIYPPGTLNATGLFSSVDSGALLATDIGALNIGASGRLELSSQNMWLTPPELPRQHNTDTFLEGNIDFGSMGSHLMDDLPMGLDYPLNIPLYPLEGVELQPVGTSSPFAQGIVPLGPGFMEEDLNIDISSVEFNELDYKGTGTPSSLAVAPSSSQGSSGDRSSLEHEQSTPNSTVKSNQDYVPAAPKRRRKPKQIFPCSFSPCSRVFEEKYKLR